MSKFLKTALKNLFASLGAKDAENNFAVPLLDATSGEPKGYMSLTNLDGVANNNVFIVTVEDTYVRCRKVNGFSASLVANAVGVMVMEGDNHIIISKDYAPSTMHWSTSNVSGGTANLSRADAFKDHDGKAKTATVVNTLGADGLMAKYCQDYYPSNLEESHDRFGKGKWFAPAAGDLWIMYKYLDEINHALSIINGELLVKEAHWSITEYSTSYAWGLNFSLGNFSTGNKSTYSSRVRPLSAL